MGPETDNFRLSVSGFSGDAGDALADPDNPNKAGNGMQFSTLIETTTNLIINALIIMVGGLTVVPHQFLINTIMPTGMQTPIRPPGTSRLPAC